MDVWISLAGYILAYLIMFPAGILIMSRLVRRGPVDSTVSESPIESGRPDLLVHPLPTASERPRL
jgi:cytochrome d ubiquinol oxidase subunit I